MHGTARQMIGSHLGREGEGLEPSLKHRLLHSGPEDQSFDGLKIVINDFLRLIQLFTCQSISSDSGEAIISDKS